jgi:A/G-specific adenine glycosylase
MKGVLPILNWYSKNKRDLPWRNTQNPYLIWLSEVILQQTRVDQGMPYYLKFTDKYPTIKRLAAAKDDEVMKLWQGLGYYNRAKNMLKTARLIVDEHDGAFPNTYEKLLTLTGIGPYTAAAIASFAYNEPKAVVDGNVYRVLSRVFAIDEPINGTQGKKIFAQLAQEIMDTANPATYNQAIMELGATVCKPTSPKCGECALGLLCLAKKKGITNQLPVKNKKAKPKERFLHYFFIEHQNQTYIKQRSLERIWHNLFEPPYIETEDNAEHFNMLTRADVQQLLGKGSSVTPVFALKHQLTHQTIYAQFWVVKVTNTYKIADKSYIAVAIKDLKQYPIHRLFDKFLQYYNPDSVTALAN